MLDIGEATTRLRWAEYDRAIALLADVTARQLDGVLATYLKTHSNEEMYRVWQELLDRFPDSVWARKLP